MPQSATADTVCLSQKNSASGGNGTLLLFELHHSGTSGLPVVLARERAQTFPRFTAS